MSTVSVKWPRVLTAWTRKTFEIRLDDGRIFVGSVAGADSGRGVVLADGDSTPVATEKIVGMVRLKRTFFQRLDGNVNLGVNFTQQNAKVDLNVSGEVRYNIPLNHFVLNLNASFSRQDSIADITRRDFGLFYSRELTKAEWFWAVTGGTQENSQLGLQNALAIGTGPGRFFVQSNRVDLAVWIAPTVRWENYDNAAPRTAYPLAFVGDFQLFSWAGLSTDLSSRLSVAPVLNDAGRWQVNFTTSVNRELVNQVYLTLGITETYDSKPPSNTNKNDFSLTSSLGWTF